MSKRPRHGKATGVAPSTWAANVSWWALMSCVALFPFVMSITPGRDWAYTADAYHLPKALVLSVLAMAASAAWVIDVLAYRRPVRAGRVLLPLGAFAILALLSTALAPEPLSSLLGASMLSTGTTTWLLSAWLGVLAAQHVTSTTRLRQLSWALVAGCSVVAGIAVLQAAGADPLAVPISDNFRWMVNQGSSTTGNPNYTGMLLALPVVLAVALGLSGRRGALQPLAFGLAGLMAAAIFITLTRAAWLGAAIGVVVLLALAPGESARRRRRLLVAAAAVIATAALAYLILGRTNVLNRFALLSGGVDAFTSGRLSLWRDALAIIGNHPLFGTGADRLALGGYEVQKDLVFQGAGRFVLQDPHNAALLIAGIFGLPAFASLAAYAALVISAGWRSLKSRTIGSEGSLLFAAWFAGLLGLVVGAAFSVWTITAVIVSFVALGVVLAPSLRPREERGPRMLAAAGGALALVLAAVSLYGNVTAVAAQHHVVLSRVSDSQYHLEEAMRITPWDAKTASDYYWRKIVAMRPTLQGDDAAASRAMAAALDAEIKASIQRFPRDLLFYRLRADLYAQSQGYPGYEEERLLAALDDALAAFPGDPEFTARKQQLLDRSGR